MHSNMTLNSEIQRGLETLKSLHEAQNGSITLSSCVSAMVKQLKLLLDRVTLHKAHKHVLQELQANLKQLKGSSQKQEAGGVEQGAGGGDPQCTSACLSALVSPLTFDLSTLLLCLCCSEPQRHIWGKEEQNTFFTKECKQ
ncbi:hypothetical protein EYF80_049091 [Liparis tanakae]|uniref:Uncharacterized protein n=1 Tax=Liparis tanakae TaxID=230148 RepID=A0A4Z2FIY8_9TELE|nr:hypothetical protein EYF80_049091 [Liparis tanakae]